MLPSYNLACIQPSWQDNAFFNIVASKLKSATSPKLQGDLKIPHFWLTKENIFLHIMQGASVNWAILQHCFLWFGNTGADAAITIFLPTLERFSCRGTVDWSTTCFCCESVLQKW